MPRVTLARTLAAASSLAACAPSLNATAPSLDATASDTAAAPSPHAADAGFTPAVLPNLVLWLEAGRGVAAGPDGRVSRWTDQSAYHNDAMQAEVARQPSLVTNALGGRPAVRFKKSVLTIADAASLDWNTGDFALVVVGNYRNAPGIHTNGWAFFFHKHAEDKFGTQNEPAEVILAGNWPAGSTVLEVTKLTLSLNAHGVKCHSRDQGFNDGVFRVISGFRVDGKLNLRVDGESQGMARGTWNVDSVGSPAAIGSTAKGNFPLDGDIAELIALAGPTAPEDLAAVERYLSAKYGIVTPTSP
jgi:hypothetical protein